MSSVSSMISLVGWREEALEQPANWRQTFEPVFVLRKPSPVEEFNVNEL